MAHVRRKFVDIYRSQGSPIAEEASADRSALRCRERGQRLAADVRSNFAKHTRPGLRRSGAMAGHATDHDLGQIPLAAAIRYALARMERLRPTSTTASWSWTTTRPNAACAHRLGRKNYLFVGSEAGGKAAAIAYTLIETAKLNAVDPLAWLADTLARIPDYKITKVDDLLHGVGTDSGQPDGYEAIPSDASVPHCSACRT